MNLKILRVLFEKKMLIKLITNHKVLIIRKLTIKDTFLLCKNFSKPIAQKSKYSTFLSHFSSKKSSNIKE